MKRVLVVEDDPLMADLLALILRAPDTEVDIAGSAVAGVVPVITKHYDLILMDHHMPTVTGLAFLQSLRQDARLQRTSIVMLTSDHSEDTIAQARYHAADGFIFKPFDPARLATQVKRLLERPRGGWFEDRTMLDQSHED